MHVSPILLFPDHRGGDGGSGGPPRPRRRKGARLTFPQRRRRRRVPYPTWHRRRAGRRPNRRREGGSETSDGDPLLEEILSLPPSNVRLFFGLTYSCWSSFYWTVCRSFGTLVTRRTILLRLHIGATTTKLLVLQSFYFLKIRTSVPFNFWDQTKRRNRLGKVGCAAR
jgi:hypothetical protein